MGDVIYWKCEAMRQSASLCSEKEDVIFSTTVHPVHKHEHTVTENALRKQALEDINTLSATELSKKYASEFNSWRNMKQRARKKEYIAHPFLEKFKDFLYHAGPKPHPSFTYDRIDYNNPEYSPENCRWASKSLQSANRSMARLFTDSHGRTLSLVEWERVTGISADTIRNRVDRCGWSEAEAISIPVGGRPKRETTPRAKTSGIRLGQLWELYLREYHKQEFCHLDAKHLRMLKEIVESLQRADQDSETVLRFLIQSWPTFCTYAEKRWGAYNAPDFPTVQFLRGNLNAAGNFFLQYSRGEPTTVASTQPVARHTTRHVPNKTRENQAIQNEDERPATKEEALAILTDSDERVKKF